VVVVVVVVVVVKVECSDKWVERWGCWQME
jgi:hypothetical protein